MERPPFVDCHSHVVPSGDDGAASVGVGELLCLDAAAHGTGVLFATPHVWPHLPLTAARAAAIRERFAELAPRAGLELRLGFELTPAPALLDEDPRRYELVGTGAVLMEVPFSGSASPLVLLAEHAEAAGLLPVIAHPERAETVLERPACAVELAERGWVLQVNACSLNGRNGAAARELGWRLLEQGHARLVASDGHRQTRPARLDEAYDEAVGRLGAEPAAEVFCGAALGFAPR
jgi:protein-tyrosine phosphatase